MLDDMPVPDDFIHPSLNLLPKLPTITIVDGAIHYHYINERTVKGVRYLYFPRHRCTVESWEKDNYPRYELRKPKIRRRKLNRNL